MRIAVLMATVAVGAMSAAPKIEGPFPAREGETCAVCNTRLSRDDVAFLIDGQRLAVMREMREALLGEPLTYLARYKPEGMMFSGERRDGVAGVYFWLGAWVLAGLLFGGLNAHMALGRGLAPAMWFALGFVFTAPASLALWRRPRSASSMGGLKRIGSTRHPVDCPACGASNHPAANACSSCRAPMVPSANSETAAC